MPLPPDLHAFLLLQVTVDQRDPEATRQALRHAATTLEPREAEHVARTLAGTIPPKARTWLSLI